MALIQVIEYEQAEGELRNIYEDIIKTRGKLAEVHKIQSLNPASIVAHMDLYMTIMFGKSPLKRVVREIIAVVVSVTNKCDYCKEHHLQAVSHYWKDPDRLDLISNNFRNPKIELTNKEIALCEFAEKLTLNKTSNYQDDLMYLKKAGLEDREILDATLVIAYFNFVNRIVLGLGANLEKDSSGYEY